MFGKTALDDPDLSINLVRDLVVASTAYTCMCCR